MSSSHLKASALPPWADPARTQQNNFDFLRLVFALLVVLTHSYPIAGVLAGDPLQRSSLAYPFGGIAVDGFFLVSGYLITASWLARPSLVPFLAKRIRRIYPAFVVMMLVCVVVVAPLGHDADYEYPPFRWRFLRKAILTTLSLGEYTRPDTFTKLPVKYVLNISTWTIRYEGLCYLLLAAVGLAGLLRRPAALGVCYLLTLSAWALLILTAGSSSAGAQALTALRCFGPFLAGSTFYVLRARIPMRWWLTVLCALAWYAIARAGGHWPYFAASTAGAYLVFYAAFLPTRPLYRIARFGDFSYGTYLYACPIQQLLAFYFPQLLPLPLFALAAPLSLVAGALSWHGVEKWFIRRRHVPKGEASGSPPPPLTMPTGS